jgi:hypothetical protein
MLRVLIPALRPTPCAVLATRVWFSVVPDPERPKRPLSPYFRFAADYRAQFKDVKIPAPELAAKWKALSEQEAAPYQQAFLQDKAAHDKEMERYKESGRSEYFKRDPEKPKQPLTPFLAWAQEQRKTGIYATMKLTDAMQALRPVWENIPQAEKDELRRTYDRAKEQHKAQVEEYRSSGKHEKWLAATGRQAKIDQERAKHEQKMRKAAEKKAVQKEKLAVAKERAARKEAAAKAKEKAQLRKAAIQQNVQLETDKLKHKLEEIKVRSNGMIAEEDAKHNAKRDSLQKKVIMCKEALREARSNKKPEKIEKAAAAVQEVQQKLKTEACAHKEKRQELRRQLGKKVKDVKAKASTKVKELREKMIA